MKGWVVTIAAVTWLSAASARAQCPAVGQDTGCGAVITITDTGAIVSLTGQGPYDGADDTLIGVVNNGSQPVSALGLSSGLAIFEFDGDGITSFGIPGNAQDNTGYGGPNAYFSDISGAKTSGIVHFITPIAAGGGKSYFSLENALTAATACSSLINNSVTQKATGASIDATFTPKQNKALAETAKLCGFKNFDWIQKITHKDDPSIFYARNTGGAFDKSVTGPVNLTSKRVPWNDPPQGGGYTYTTSPDNSYPFFYDVSTELSAFETSTTLTFHDAPSDSCLPGGSKAGKAPCGNKTEPAGSFVAFTTHLAGVKEDGSAIDLKIGFGWKSDFNGTTGGVNILKTNQQPDPGSGTGGVTITDTNGITDYDYNGITVTTVNGVPVAAIVAVPTLSAWSLLLLAFVLGICGVIAHTRLGT